MEDLSAMLEQTRFKKTWLFARSSKMKRVGGLVHFRDQSIPRRPNCVQRGRLEKSCQRIQGSHVPPFYCGHCIVTHAPRDAGVCLSHPVGAITGGCEWRISTGGRILFRRRMPTRGWRSFIREVEHCQCSVAIDEHRVCDPSLRVRARRDTHASANAGSGPRRTLEHMPFGGQQHARRPTRRARASSMS